MRVLLVATDVQVPGEHGGSTHVSELFSAISRRGETLLLARSDSRGANIVPLGRPLQHNNQVLRQLDAARLLPSALSAVRKFRPEVIYERCSSYGLGALLSMATGAPLLTMILDERYSWLSLVRAQTLVATRLDLIPTPVRYKASMVHWGANAERFSAKLPSGPPRAALGLKPGDFLVAYAGSFKRWHGLTTLVQAAERLKPSAHFLMLGEGPCRAEIEALASRAGLAEWFHFTGSVPYAEVPDLLAAADVCVAPFDPEQHAPSRQRGSFVLDPLKVFEYLALGKPTITIRADNLLNIFQNGEHLLMVEPGHADALSGALDWVRNQRLQAAEMARRGHELVLQNYTWQAHADQLLRLFDGMLQR